MRARPSAASLAPFLALLLPAAARAQDLIGVQWNGLVYRVDSGTGASVFMGPSGMTGLNSLARDASGNAYTHGWNEGLGAYWIAAIDRVTGAATPVMPLGLDVRSMAFADDGKLLVAAVSGELFSVNLAAGTHTLIGPFLLDGFFAGTQAMAYRDGRLYGWQNELLEIDPATAAMAHVGAVPPYVDVQSLCFDACGRLLGGRGSIYEFDVHTGAHSLVSVNGLDLRGFEPAPVPSLQKVRLGSPPNPLAFLASPVPPALGATWSPSVAPFVSGALVDLALVSALPANEPSPFGTLLCSLASPASFVKVQAPAGVPFSFPIPASCGLLGLTLSVQGGSASATAIQLANALDLVIGDV